LSRLRQWQGGNKKSLLLDALFYHFLRKLLLGFVCLDVKEGKFDQTVRKIEASRFFVLEIKTHVWILG
jgi:hypothetical protein